MRKELHSVGRNPAADQSRNLNEPQPNWYELKTQEFNKEYNKNRAQSLHEAKLKQNGETVELTKESRQAIIEAKFDFATLSGCVSDIRKGFWSI